MVYLVSGGSWLLFEQGASILLSLGLAVLFGHFVSQDTYGNYKYILNVSGLLGIFSLSGLGTAVTRAAARGDEGALTQGFVLNLRWGSGIVMADFSQAHITSLSAIRSLEELSRSRRSPFLHKWLLAV